MTPYRSRKIGAREKKKKGRKEENPKKELAEFPSIESRAARYARRPVRPPYRSAPGRDTRRRTKMGGPNHITPDEPRPTTLLQLP